MTSFNKNPNDFGRLGVGSIYWDISKKHYKKYCKLKNKCDESSVHDREWDEKHFKNTRQRDQSGLITILFSAIFLESEIYTFLAHYYTDSFTQKHLDKLDPLSKWVVGLQLVTGKSISRDGQAYEYCQKLFSYRNKIVHSKSRPMEWDTEKLSSQIEKSEHRFDDMVHNSHKAVIELAKFTKSIIEESWRPLLFVLEDENTFSI